MRLAVLLVFVFVFLPLSALSLGCGGSGRADGDTGTDGETLADGDIVIDGDTPDGDADADGDTFLDGDSDIDDDCVPITCSPGTFCDGNTQVTVTETHQVCEGQPCRGDRRICLDGCTEIPGEGARCQVDVACPGEVVDGDLDGDWDTDEEMDRVTSCVGVQDVTPCDDGDPATHDDLCFGGECFGQDWCLGKACRSDADCCGESYCALQGGTEEGTCRYWHVFPNGGGRLSYSPDGLLLAAASENRIRVFDTVRRRVIRTLIGHDDYIGTVDFAPDGTTLASGSNDRTIGLWDVRTGTRISTLSGHEDDVEAVAFSPDGHTLASASPDGTVRLWDWNLAGGVCTNTLIGHEDDVQAVAFSPSGQFLAGGSRDTTIRIWDVGSGTLVRTLRGHHSQVLSVNYSPDGSHLVSGSYDHAVRIWDPATGECIQTVDSIYGPPDQRAIFAAFSPDGTNLAIIFNEPYITEIKVWDLETENFTHSVYSYGYYLEYAPDGRTLGITASAITIWDIDSDEYSQLTGTSHFLYFLNMSPTGDTFTTSGIPSVELWDIHTGEYLTAFEQGTTGWYFQDFSPGGTVLANWSQNDIHLWAALTGEWIQVIEKDVDYPRNSVVFSPDGGRLATSGNKDASVRVWCARSELCLHTLEGHASTIRAVAFLPDGERLASGSDDATIRIWDLASGECLRVLEGHESGVSALAVSSDGTVLASGGEDTTVRLWDIASGAGIRTFTGHDGSITSLYFLPDGETLVSVDGELTEGGSTILFRDIDTGSVRFSVTKSFYSLFSPYLFTPDGRIMVRKVGTDLEFIETATGTVIGTIPCPEHETRIFSVQFTPDGRSVVCCSERGIISIRDVSWLTGRGADSAAVGR